MRPDILMKIDPKALNSDDRKILAENNFICVGNEYKEVIYRSLNLNSEKIRKMTNYSEIVDFFENNYDELLESLPNNNFKKTNTC